MPAPAPDVPGGRARPVVIAHRGASGYLPEHSLAAKAMAHAFGADYLEQDLCMTRDGEVVVIHDPWLDELTDVADRFPARARADGRTYVPDLTLAELRTLRLSERFTVVDGERRAVYPGRFPVMTGDFRIPTFHEELELIAGLARSTGRVAGIYPEVKSPWLHHQAGLDLAGATLRILRDHGYRRRDDPVFVQCFDPHENRRMRSDLMPALGIDLRIVQLLAETAWEETMERRPDGSWAPLDYAPLLTADGLAAIAAYADGIGPWIPMVIRDDGGVPRPTDLVARAHAAGLVVHPYTARADALPAWAGSHDAVLDAVLGDAGADGIFTDHCDLGVRWVSARWGVRESA